MAREIQLLPPTYRSAVKHETLEGRHAALCCELEQLRAEIKRLEKVSEFKSGVLLDTARFFEEILRNNNPQSIEGLKRLVSRLKGAADRQQGGL